MPGRRPLAALMLAALLCACEALPDPPREAARADPPSRGARTEADARPASPADVAATPGVPGRDSFEPASAARRRADAPTGADAIASLRQRLRARGFGLDVAAGPMVAVWSDSPPPTR